MILDIINSFIPVLFIGKANYKTVNHNSVEGNITRKTEQRDGGGFLNEAWMRGEKELERQPSCFEIVVISLKPGYLTQDSA